MSLCPCSSTLAYEQCCELFIKGVQLPKTAEELMRSRYAAYSKANIDYIKKTMKDKALSGFNDIEAKQWAQRVCFIGLTVLQHKQESPNKSHVEFKCLILDKNKLATLHEISEFQLENETWYYVDGTLKNDQKTLTISRNSICPCGSGRKFKNCHDKANG